MKRRMLSLILTICMVVTFLPQLTMTAQAAEYGWQNLGGAGFSDGKVDFTSLYVYDGTPYVAYADRSNSFKATVMKYTGTGDTGWEVVGSAGFSAGEAYCTSLYVYDGTPYVAYEDLGNSYKATVMKYTGAGDTGWEAVGSAGFSGGSASDTSLYVYDGTPYVAYTDTPYSFKATVMKYTGAGDTGWEAVGSAGFSAGIANYNSLYVYDGTPYVAYTDGGNSSKATVMKYTGTGGTGWEAVGSAGFSEDEVYYTSLYVYDGTPYVAYRDSGNSYKATVMKYTGAGGTGWEAVGSAGFSEDGAGYTSLYVYDGTLYVAYMDNYKATVMKYTGAGDTGWEAVGSTRFSTGYVSCVSLYVYDDTPYVAFEDGDNSYKMTVMYYGEIVAASISPELSLSKENLDTNSLTVALSGTTFADSTLDASNFTLNNAPTGVTVESVSYTDTTTCTVALAYDGTDFDTNVTDFSLTIAASELDSGSDLTSGTLTITATAEAPSSPTFNPANGATDVLISAAPTLTFSETLCSDASATSMGTSPIGVIKVYEGTDNTGTALTENTTADNLHYTVAYDSSAYVFTVTFGASMKYSQSYYVELQANTVYNAAGNPIATAEGAAFTTAAPPTHSTGRHSSSSDSDDSDDGAKVIVNGESHTAGTAETTTNGDGQTQTTVAVETDKLQKLLEEQEDGATVTVPIPSGSDAAAGVLTGEMVDAMEQSGATLVIQTEDATYMLPAEEIDITAVSEQFGEDIDLSDITVTITIAEPSDETVTIVENAAEEGGFSIVVPAVDFTITCEFNGATVAVSSFNSYVERLIVIPDGVDPEKITTGVVVNPDGTVRHVPTQIIEVDGVYYAVIITA